MPRSRDRSRLGAVALHKSRSAGSHPSSSARLEHENEDAIPESLRPTSEDTDQDIQSSRRPGNNYPSRTVMDRATLVLPSSGLRAAANVRDEQRHGKDHKQRRSEYFGVVCQHPQQVNEPSLVATWRRVTGNHQNAIHSLTVLAVQTRRVACAPASKGACREYL
jgi:hypothetical protein